MELNTSTERLLKLASKLQNSVKDNKTLQDFMCQNSQLLSDNASDLYDLASLLNGIEVIADSENSQAVSSALHIARKIISNVANSAADQSDLLEYYFSKK